MEITEVTPAPFAKWPLWTWFAYPALAIAIGGGLGYATAVIRQPSEPAPVHVAAEPVVAAPQPTPTRDVTPPSSEIEITPDPDPVKAAGDGAASHVTSKPRAKSKPTKRCNVYDHMDGC